MCFTRQGSEQRRFKCLIGHKPTNESTGLGHSAQAHPRESSPATLPNPIDEHPSSGVQFAGSP